eukprot:gb/GECG01015172.1/.p1 GENE.gb/GECG01015172.1/~~gb/GECG01015172.1/.p1  ORF type:complete len:121 (+),score=16.20 gb/GECG01015172.1/:1-363(+)
MESVNSTSFCPRCGSLFILSDTPTLECRYCSYETNMKNLASVSVTYSRQQPQHSWQTELHQQRKEQTASHEKHRAMVDEECPSCKNPQMLFYTMQLRSADEGQTVFYECPKCGHKSSTEN